MRGYRLTKAAADDVVAIFLEGLLQFGLDQADRYHEGMAATFDFLAEYQRATWQREEIDGTVRVYPHRMHVIVYELEPDDTVVVLRVRHAREGWLSQPL